VTNRKINFDIVNLRQISDWVERYRTAEKASEVGQWYEHEGVLADTRGITIRAFPSRKNPYTGHRALCISTTIRPYPIGGLPGFYSDFWSPEDPKAPNDYPLLFLFGTPCDPSNRRNEHQIGESIRGQIVGSEEDRSGVKATWNIWVGSVVYEYLSKLHETSADSIDPTETADTRLFDVAPVLQATERGPPTPQMYDTRDILDSRGLRREMRPVVFAESVEEPSSVTGSRQIIPIPDLPEEPDAEAEFWDK
jgi:hypothetical protein